MGRVVAHTRDSIESPVFAPRVARMFPLVMLRSFIRPSVPPTATTVLVGLIAREVNGPASNRASKSVKYRVGCTFSCYFPGYCTGLGGPAY